MHDKQLCKEMKSFLSNNADSGPKLLLVCKSNTSPSTTHII